MKLQKGGWQSPKLPSTLLPKVALVAKPLDPQPYIRETGAICHLGGRGVGVGSRDGLTPQAPAPSRTMHYICGSDGNRGANGGC